MLHAQAVRRVLVAGRRLIFERPRASGGHRNGSDLERHHPEYFEEGSSFLRALTKSIQGPLVMIYMN